MTGDGSYDVSTTGDREQEPGHQHKECGLDHRGKLDNTPEVREFAEKLEDVVVKTVESGKMTKDLALLVGSDQAYQTTEEFLATLDENLAKALKA